MAPFGGEGHLKLVGRPSLRAAPGESGVRPADWAVLLLARREGVRSGGGPSRRGGRGGLRLGGGGLADGGRGRGGGAQVRRGRRARAQLDDPVAQDAVRDLQVVVQLLRAARAGRGTGSGGSPRPCACAPRRRSCACPTRGGRRSRRCPRSRARRSRGSGPGARPPSGCPGGASGRREVLRSPLRRRMLATRGRSPGRRGLSTAWTVACGSACAGGTSPVRWGS